MSDMASHERGMLRELLEAGTKLLSGGSEEEVLHSILLGLKAFGFDRVRLYLLSDDGQQLLPKDHLGMDDDFMQTPRRVADDRPMRVLLQERQAHLFRAEETGPSSFGVSEWICAPLILQGKVIGKLSADNKESSHLITKDQCETVALFADQAAAAIEHAQLLRNAESLMASSPTAIIVNDMKGKVTQFNSRARELLGYSAADPPPNTIWEIFAHPDEPGRVGELLNTNKAKLRNYETQLKAKNGQQISVLMSASWFLDAAGQRVGAVGHFEDLRALRTVENQHQLLLEASNTVAQADSPTDGLQGLAKLIVHSLPHSFCRILLVDEQNTFLSPKAAYPVGQKDTPLEWDPQLGVPININKVPGLAALLNDGLPRVVRLSDPVEKKSMEVFSDHLRLSPPVQSVLMVPLKIQNRLVGLLEVGELRSEARSPISQEEIDLVFAIASQSTTLIDRLRRQEVNEHQRLLLEKLDHLSRNLVPEKGVDALLQQAVRLAADLLEGTASAIYEYFSGPDSYELRHYYGRFHEILGHPQPLASTLLREVCQNNNALIKHIKTDPSHVEQQTHSSMTAIGVPLRDPHTGAVEYVLLVINQPRESHFIEVDREFLRRFATRTALTLATAQAMSPEQRKLGLFPLLHKIGDYLQSTGDIEKISHVALTGITAGYGLGFNRAALFLLDESQDALVGKMGIGHLTEAAATHDWEQGPRNRLDDVAQYLKTLEAGTLAETPLDQVIRGLRVELNEGEQNPFARCVHATSAFLVSEAELSGLPTQFHLAFQPSSELVFAPLKAGERVIGVVVADNKFLHHPIRLEDLDLLMALINTAAIAIANLQLLDETKTAKDRLQALYEASAAVLTIQDPDVLIRDIVDRLREASGAAWVYWVAVDEHGVLQEPIAAGGFQPFDVHKIRPNGLTAEVLRTGNPVFIEDTARARDRVNPLVMQENVCALLCLPLRVQQTQIGVMWLHYKKPHHFTEEEILDLQFYVNQVVVAYDIAKRRDNLDRVRRASEALAAAATLSEVEDAIEQQAKIAFQAMSVFVWRYDPRREQFLQAKSANPYISASLREQATLMEPLWRQSAQLILQREWVSVHDVDDPQYGDLIAEPILGWLDQAGIRSYQAIGLQAGNGPLGVAYVNYDRPRRFTHEEQTLLHMFGTQASLALRKALLFEQLQDANAAAQTVAEVSTLGDLDTTLREVTRGTQRTLDCDAVTLYAYDKRTDTLSYPPESVELWHEEQVRCDEQVKSGSIIWTMLKRDEPYMVEAIEADPLFAATQFARREGIKSCIVLPLRAAEQKVGVMFVNYRTHHHFTTDELPRLQLYANQASVAIHNAQLYEQARKQTKSLETLHASAQVITSSLDSAEVLRRIGEQAWRLTRDHGEHVGVANVWQLENDQLQLVTVFPDSAREHMPGPINLAPDATTRIGIVGRAVRQNHPQRVVMNIDDDTDYIRATPSTKSQLAVPITVDGKVIGAISVEDPHLNAFQEQDQQVIESLAAQAGISIQNARQYEELETTYEELETTKGQVAAQTAILWMGMAGATWRHTTRTDTQIIIEQVQRLRNDFQSGKLSEKLDYRLNLIDYVSKRILDTPITRALSANEGAEPILINDIIHERIGQQKKISAEEKQDSVKYRLSISQTEHYYVRMNPQWLAHAFDIIVDNAREVVTASTLGQITISTRVFGNKLEILVRDNGGGIPSGILSHLFQRPIKKLHGTKGMGMGLILARTIVRTYAGDIYVETTDKSGTTMVIQLPIESRGIGTKLTASSGNILLVSNANESSWIHVLNQALLPLGTIEREDEKGALKKSEPKHYELIVVDATLLDEVPLLVSYLRDRHPQTKIIVAAASPDWRIAREAFRAGASDYILKSSSSDELQTILNRTLQLESLDVDRAVYTYEA